MPANPPRYLQLRASSIQSLMTTLASSVTTAWSPNTPATINEPLIVSAPKINTNFNTIGDGFAADHNPLGSTINVGQHNQSTYITQTTTPTADPNNIRLFSALVATVPQIFAQYPTSVAPSPFQLTNIASTTNYNPATGYTVSEISFLLNTQIMKIGTILVLNVYSSVQITFNTPFTTAITIFGCMPSGTANPQNYNITGIGLAGFIINNAATGTYLYIVIGT